MSRFKKLEAKLAKQAGVTDAGGLAYKIGKRKFGAKVMKKAAQLKKSAASVAKKK